MCLLAIAWKTVPGWPLVVLANREEAYSRATAPPGIHRSIDGRPAWMGGLDLLAGGTWLGINERGLFVAVTNRPKRLIPAAPHSRGLLCRTLLECAGADAACRLGVRQIQETPYAGCNLVAVDNLSGFVIEAGDAVKTTALEPGLHIVTNGDLDDPGDGRIARVRNELDFFPKADWNTWLNSAMRLCGARAAGELPAVCLEGPDRGTVSSTVLMLAEDPGDSQYWYAPGPPSRTPYEDLSPIVRRLLLGINEI